MGTNLTRHPAPDGFDISELKDGSLGSFTNELVLKFSMPTFTYVVIPKEAIVDEDYMAATLKYGLEGLIKEIQKKIEEYDSNG